MQGPSGMSASLEPPPPVEVIQQAYAAHSDHGSVGTVIAVVAVITILGAIAVVIGKLCSGRRVMGYGQYDFEGWVETKCGSCIDGQVDPPRPPPPPPPAAAESTNGSSEVARQAAEAPNGSTQHNLHETA